jgi:hypothetical protein
MTFKQLIIILSMVLPLNAFAQTLKITELFHALSLIKTEQKNFIEMQQDPFLEILQTRTGVMHYQSPSLLEQRYQTPIKGRITFTPTLIKIAFPNRTVELSVERFPEVSLFSQTLLTLLRGDLNTLRKNFTLTFQSKDNLAWQLDLTPTNQLKKHLQSIKVAGSKVEITSILFTKRSGEWRKITLQPNPPSTPL